jgi:hypothetical protein
MRRILTAAALLTGLSVGALAEDWSGKLIDATCNEQQQHEKTVSCDATNATTVFALDVMGKIYKLDPAGNSKAAAALKYRADPSGTASPSKPASTDVRAKVTGTEVGGMILVETIGLQ